MSSYMPSQLTNLLELPALSHYTELFSNLFLRLPQDLATQFWNCLASTLDVVHSTLPPALTSPLPENLAMPNVFQDMLTDLISILTIMLGTMITTVRFFDQANAISRVVSEFLTNMNTELYGNPSFDLPSLLTSLHSNMTNAYFFTSQPYSALTNFPNELFSMLNNTPPSVLHPLPLELDSHLYDMVYAMAYDVSFILDFQHEQLWNDVYNSPAGPDYDLEGLSVQYVYQARGDADTDPDKCSVCLEEMKDGDNARRLGCSHSFHVQCIDRWLETKRSCPLCRTPIDATHD